MIISNQELQSNNQLLINTFDFPSGRGEKISISVFQLLFQAHLTYNVSPDHRMCADLWSGEGQRHQPPGKRQQQHITCHMS